MDGYGLARFGVPFLLLSFFCVGVMEGGRGGGGVLDEDYIVLGKLGIYLACMYVYLSSLHVPSRSK